MHVKCMHFGELVKIVIAKRQKSVDQEAADPRKKGITSRYLIIYCSDLCLLLVAFLCGIGVGLAFFVT